MGKHQCPICGQSFDPDQSTALPFCSDRCKMIDLGRWLDEQYGIPVERQQEAEQGTEQPPE